MEIEAVQIRPGDKVKWQDRNYLVRRVERERGTDMAMPGGACYPCYRIEFLGGDTVWAAAVEKFQWLGKEPLSYSPRDVPYIRLWNSNYRFP